MTGNKIKDQSSQSRALEGLPPKFVTAMRTLFDVLDDNKTGTVSLADIEHWWRKDKDEHGGGTVPNGVIESLRKVATGDNNLTFERFCAGLKICLLRNHADSSKEMTDSPSEPEENNFSRVSQLRKQRYIPSQSPTPQPPPPLGSITMEPGLGALSHHGPPKPPRTSFTDSRKLGDGGVASDGEVGSNGLGNGRKQPKRRESHSRRHTLQNGIDYGLLKKMKAIEEERDGLMRGLQMVHRADDWYQEQLAGVQERMRSLGKAGGGQENPGSTEAARERLLFQNARIHEVNQHLNSLMSSDISFPMSINLAVGTGSCSGQNKDHKDFESQISRLKDQNRLLTDEVSKKCNAISILDQEKSALIRDLFQARSRLRHAEMNDAEATFM